MLWNSDDTIEGVVLHVRTQEEGDDEACFEIVYSMELRGTAKNPSLWLLGSSSYSSTTILWTADLDDMMAFSSLRL